MVEAYTKSPLTFEQQLQQLKDHGLIIENDDFALSQLRTISYYRLLRPVTTEYFMFSLSFDIYYAWQMPAMIGNNNATCCLNLLRKTANGDRLWD